VQPAQLVLRLRRHARVLGPGHDRRQGAVHVEEDRCPFRILGEPGDQIHAP
jgi:hypothetical protein